MKKRKMAAAFMAALMLTASLSGCGSSEKAESASDPSHGGAGKEEELLTIDMFCAPANYQGVQTGWFGKAIKDACNVEVNIIAPNVAGGGDSLYQTRSAAGNLGDLIVIRKDQLEDCYKAGLLYDMTDFVANSKNLKNYSKSSENLSKLLGTDRIYAFANSSSLLSPMEPAWTAVNPSMAIFSRWDYYKELGKPQLKDMDDLLDLLKQMQDAHPTAENGKKVYGFSLFKDWDSKWMRCASICTWFNGYSESNTGFLFTNGDASDYTQLDDENGIYYKMFETFFKANQMGLVDPDSSAQTFDAMQAKVGEGEVLCHFWPWLTIDNYNTPERVEQGVGFAYLPIEDQRFVVEGYNPYGTDDLVICMGSKCKNPERVFEFLDWFSSPESMMINYGGPEGLAWEKVDGKPVRTEYGRTAETINAPVPEEYGGGNFKDGKCQFNWCIPFWLDKDPATGEIFNKALWTSTVKNERNRVMDEWTETFGTELPTQYLVDNDLMEIIPGSPYICPVDSSDINIKRSQCGTAVKEASWKMVFARDKEEFDAVWQDMKTKLDGLGYNDVIAVDKANVEGFYQARKAVIEENQ